MKMLIEVDSQKRSLTPFFTKTRMLIMLSKPQKWMALFSLCVLLVTGAAQAGTELYFVHSDHLDTAKVITNQNQDVVWQADYTPFGEVVETSNQAEYRQRFPGQYQDDETGFYYNYYRDYDPSLGRYVQSDPIGLAGGLNTYAYVGGNPVSFGDPLGLNRVRINLISNNQLNLNSSAVSLIQQIRRIDPTFSYPIATPARLGQPSSYSSQSVTQLRQFLRNAKTAGFCGPGATNAPGFLNNGSVSMTNLFGNIIPPGTPNTWTNASSTFRSGFKYQWTANGTRMKVWGHTSNPNAPSGSYSSLYPTITLRVNNRTVTSTGTTVGNASNPVNAPLVHLPVTR